MLPGIASAGVLAGGGALSLIVANWVDETGPINSFNTNTVTLTFTGGARTLRLQRTNGDFSHFRSINGGGFVATANGATWSVSSGDTLQFQTNSFEPSTNTVSIFDDTNGGVLIDTFTHTTS